MKQFVFITVLLSTAGAYAQEEQKPIQLNVPKQDPKKDPKEDKKPPAQPQAPVQTPPNAQPAKPAAEGTPQGVPVTGPQPGKEADKPDFTSKRTVGFQMQPTQPEPSKTDAMSRQFLYDYNFFRLDLDEKKAMIERIQWKLGFWTSFNYFNNGDLRVLNEQNQTSIEETDDKIYFMVTGVELDAFFPIHRRLDFRVDIYRAGFWGHDQLGGRDSNNDLKYTRNGANTVSFGYLYFDTHFITAPSNSSRADLRIGRQGYEIGGQIEREYLLDDVLDSIVFRWYGKFGKLDLLALDVYAAGSNPSDVYFVQYLSYDDEKVDGFDGDVNTYRYGFSYLFPVWDNADRIRDTHLDFRAFTFFARYGGLNEGASDRTNKGTTGNFADRDFSYLRGGRVNAGFRGIVRGQLTFAESFGTDRKRPTVIYTSQDVDNNGQAFQLDLEFAFWGRRILFLPSVFWSEGGKYLADGRQYSHGFVGFKGDHAGGMLSDLNWGLYPSAYIDDDGIDDTPFERQRKSGTFQRHLGIAIGKPDVIYFRIDWWRLDDTNQINILGAPRPGISTLLTGAYQGPSIYEQQIRVDLMRYIYPTAATQLLAYRRFAAPLGEEINISMDWNVLPNWRVWAITGVFRPMRYFATAGLEQGTPQGNARFTGFQMGTSFYF